MNEDKLVKELLKSNDKLEVPSEITLGIEETLNSLEDKQISRVTKGNKVGYICKKIGLVAGVVVVALFAAGSISPSFADEIPIINKILGSNSIFNNEKKGNLMSVQNCSVSVNETKRGVTVKELGYDGSAFYLVYESNDEEGFNDPKIIVNGKEFTSGYFISEEGVNTLIFPIPVDSEIDNKFAANIVFKEIKDNSPSIAFKVNIDKQQLLSNNNKYSVNKKIKNGKLNIEITSITQSGSFVNIGTVYDKYYPNEYNQVVYDDKGNPLDQVDMGGFEEKEGKTYVTRVYKAYSNTKIDRIEIVRNHLNTELGYIPPESTYIPKLVKRINLSDKTPIKVDFKKGRSLDINKISKLDDGYELLVDFKNMPGCEYIYAGGITGGLMLRDNNKPENQINSYILPYREMLKDGSYKLTFSNEGQSSKVDFNNVSLVVGDTDDILEVIESIKLK